MTVISLRTGKPIAQSFSTPADAADEALAELEALRASTRDEVARQRMTKVSAVIRALSGAPTALQGRPDSPLDGIAALVCTIRPTWGVAGVRKALDAVKDRDLADVAIAALRAARDETYRTPAVIALGGDHWHDAKPAKDARHAERMAEAKARAAAIRSCSLCDDKGYRLPSALTLCTHRELRGRGRA